MRFRKKVVTDNLFKKPFFLVGGGGIFAIGLVSRNNFFYGQPCVNDATKSCIYPSLESMLCYVICSICYGNALC